MEAFAPVQTAIKVREAETHFPSDCDDKQAEMPAFPTRPTDCQYFSVKTETEDDIEEQKVYCLASRSEQNIPVPGHTSAKDTVSKSWALQMNSSICTDQKINVSGLSKPYLYSSQALPFQGDSLFQVDYKTRNKLKTKRRRMDPDYRDQERLRQRTVMQLKRQNPQFRAEEREKGRCRMRIKRLDPLFRSKERERQRERMKMKRLDPDFREREREQQKNRIHEKRLDPEFREKERARGRLRTRLKLDDTPMLDISREKDMTAAHGNSEIKVNGNTNLQITRQVSIAQANMCEQPQQLTGVTSVVLRTGDALFDSFRYIPPNAFNIHLHCNVREHFSSDKNCGPIYSMIKNSIEDVVHQESECFPKQYLPHLNDCVKPKALNIKSKIIDSSKTIGHSSASQSLEDKKCIS